MQTGALHRTVILTMLALSALAAPRAGAESAESLARKGNSLYKQGKYDEAAEAYREALRRNPGNALIKFNLGTALGRTGNLPDAQKTLTEAAETPGSPRRGDSYYNLGVAQAESTKKKPEDQQGQQPGPAQNGSTPGNDPLSAGPGPAGGAPQAAAPDPVAAAQQKVALLEQSLDSFRKSILTNSHDDHYKYNYETVLEMLKQARQQLEQEKQQQQQGGGKSCDKNNNGQQGQPKNQQGQQGQQQQNGQKNGQQQQGQQPGGQQNGQQGQGAQDGKGQMTPEQIDALGLLNMLESEKPEQFKQLYRFRGEDNNQQKHPTKDW